MPLSFPQFRLETSKSTPCTQLILVYPGQHNMSQHLLSPLSSEEHAKPTVLVQAQSFLVLPLKNRIQAPSGGCSRSEKRYRIHTYKGARLSEQEWHTATSAHSVKCSQVLDQEQAPSWAKTVFSTTQWSSSLFPHYAALVDPSEVFKYINLCRTEGVKSQAYHSAITHGAIKLRPN